MKNIVFIIESLNCGGAEKSLVTLLQNFNYEKYNVDLVLFNKNGDFEKFVPNEVNIFYINLYNNTPSFRLFLYRFKFWLYRKLKKRKFHNAQLHWKTYHKQINRLKKTYDIAIAYNQGLPTYFTAEKIAAKKKYAWLNIDYKLAGYNIKFDINKYIKFNKVVVVSQEAENGFLSELSKVEEMIKTIVIKDITDEKIVVKLSEEHTGLTKNTSTINICSVGRLAKQKGWHLAIYALSILLKKGYNIKWYIIGEGPERKSLEKIIKHEKLENNLILLGYKENPYPYIKSCDIYAQTSLFEGLGLTVIEAAVLQKPIVTTNFPTASTIITNNKTGLICSMNAKDIATSIEKYLKNPELMNEVLNNLYKQKNNDKERSLTKIGELLNA
ncbi:glycosyltransferase [Flavobacteriaceae bacterium GSB9]|nr:glycosyltransferase [Flavobacteriaceae bacterium GSB9]